MNLSCHKFGPVRPTTLSCHICFAVRSMNLSARNHNTNKPEAKKPPIQKPKAKSQKPKTNQPKTRRQNQNPEARSQTARSQISGKKQHKKTNKTALQKRTDRSTPTLLSSKTHSQRGNLSKSETPSNSTACDNSQCRQATHSSHCSSAGKPDTVEVQVPESQTLYQCRKARHGQKPLVPVPEGQTL